MIVRCNYEELTALRYGARTFLRGDEGEGGTVAAPPEGRERVERLLLRLEGDFSVETLEEQRILVEAVEPVVECLRVEMEGEVAGTHPAAEEAVAAYFDFAHAFSVLSRIREMGEEMEALIELMTGDSVTPEEARTFVFPD